MTRGQTHLLHHTAWLELVTVRQTAHQAPLSMAIDPQPIRLAARSAERLATFVRFGALNGELCLRCLRILLPFVGDILRSLMSLPLLLCLSVEKEVAQYSARTPEEPICPTFDATLVLVKHKDRAGGDHLPFRVD